MYSYREMPTLVEACQILNSSFDVTSAYERRTYSKFLTARSKKAWR